MGADRGTPAPGTAELSFTTKKTGSSRLRPDTVKDVEGIGAVLGFGGISTQRAKEHCYSAGGWPSSSKGGGAYAYYFAYRTVYRGQPLVAVLLLLCLLYGLSGFLSMSEGAKKPRWCETKGQSPSPRMMRRADSGLSHGTSNRLYVFTRQLSGGGRGSGQSPDHGAFHYDPLFRCSIAKAITGRRLLPAVQLPVIDEADPHRKTSLSTVIFSRWQ